MLENTDRPIKKGNPEKLATFGREDTRQRQTKTINKTVCFGDHYMQTNTKPVPDFSIGLVGGSLGPQHLGGPRPVYNIFVIVVDLSYACCHKPSVIFLALHFRIE